MISAMVKFLFHCHIRTSYYFYFQYDLVGETDRTGDHDPKKRAADIITKLDVSGDKKLSKAEFIAGYVLELYFLIYVFVLY
jgi:hypothetical protein